MRELILTFDVEDFTSEKSMLALRKMLELLENLDLKGLLFLTGHATEKLSSYPEVLDLLRNHELGYHSSSHSVRPTVFEYTDVQSYDEAVQRALLRETSHVDLFTGETEGSGGIRLLRDLFPNKLIASFRAPGLCWLPTVSEALRKLGVIYDFSTDLCRDPVSYKGITFYPYPLVVAPPEGPNFKKSYIHISYSLLTRPVTVLLLHPHSIVRSTFWDSVFFSGNPKKLISATERNQKEQSRLLWRFSNFFKYVAALRRVGAIEVTASLRQSRMILKPSKQLVQNAYLKSVCWPKHFFKYQPRFLYSHYLKFFDMEMCA